MAIFFLFTLQIFDGASDSDPVIGTYCSTITPPPLITSGHEATVLFHSDYSRQDAGFNIAYSALPGEQFQAFQNDTACNVFFNAIRPEFSIRQSCVKSEKMNHFIKDQQDKYNTGWT